jgi:cysteine synthase
MIRKAYRTTSEAYELPKIIQLGSNLFAASFFLMKLMPARFILDCAQRAGLLHDGVVVIETTSGTFGLALAILCAERGLPLIIVSDPAIDTPLKRRLEDLGARVEIVGHPAATGGYQRARLDRMAELMAEHPNHFSPSQYDNPHNPDAYAPLVELIVEAVGITDCLVGPVGSGGSMCGASNYMRTILPKLHAIGVDTFGSVLFGQPDQKRLLRGLGNSLLPGNLNHTVFDDVHWVSAGAAFAATRQLHRSHALFAGPTSGAAYLVARWWAAQHPDKVTVCLFPDEGYRYISTVYDDDWLRANKLLVKEPPSEPLLAKSPAQAQPGWAYMKWNGRTYAEVMNRHVEGEVTHESTLAGAS